MINIGPIWIYQIVIIGIFVIGAFLGLLIKTWGQVYFVFMNLIWFFIIFGIASYVMPLLEKDLNRDFVNFINGTGLSDQSKQVAQGAAPVAFTIFLDFLYYAIAFVFLNIVSYLLYLIFFRKKLKNRGFMPRPLFVIGGALVSFVESYFVGFFVISFAASSLFYNGGTSFKQELIMGLDNDLNRNDYKNGIHDQFKYFYPISMRRNDSIGKITNALNNWYWITNYVERADNPQKGYPKTPVPMIESFSDNENYNVNVINLFNSLSDYARTQFTTNLIGPLLSEWSKIKAAPVFDKTFNWSKVMLGIKAYFELTDQPINGPIPLSASFFDKVFNVFTNDRHDGKINFCSDEWMHLTGDYRAKPFCQITSYVAQVAKDPIKSKTDPVYAILKDGASFYNVIHNFMSLSNYAKDDKDMALINTIMHNYGFNDFYLFKPAADDHNPNATKNYSDIKIFFGVKINNY